MIKVIQVLGILLILGLCYITEPAGARRMPPPAPRRMEPPTRNRLPSAPPARHAARHDDNRRRGPATMPPPVTESFMWGPYDFCSCETGADYCGPFEKKGGECEEDGKDGIYCCGDFF